MNVLWHEESDLEVGDGIDSSTFHPNRQTETHKEISWYMSIYTFIHYISSDQVAFIEVER